MQHNYVAIMAGGVGSRFWPMSRSNCPKQFLDILGTGKTLIQATVERFERICPTENIYILTNESYRELVKSQLPQLSDDQILGEPMRKNTAPCIAYFTHKIRSKDPKANMIIAPSDHLVTKEDEFVKVAQRALEFTAKKNALLTLGITPSRPDTGYGYIQFDEKHVEPHIHRVKTFTEKPILKMAQQFLDSGDFVWNAGIFIWNVSTIWNALEKNLPDIHDAFSGGQAIYNTPKESEFISKAFGECPSISIDYGIMEKADNVYVLPCDFGWSDLGTWASLYANIELNDAQNAIAGDQVITYNSQENMISTTGKKLVVLNSVDNLIVVETDDVILISNKDKEQDVKQIVNEIKRQKGQKFI